MRFSVIVPCYNVEKYIHQCVDSILEQKYQDFELILVNDGSTDQTAAILDEYKSLDGRITVVHKENGGLTSARKAGANIAQGDYIVCVDGDDWVDYKQLDEYSSIIDQCNADIICCGYYRSTDTEVTQKCLPNSIGNRYGFFDRKEIEDQLLPNLFAFNPSVWSKVFKKDIYLPAQMSLNDKVCMGEDGAISYVCLYRANSIYVLDQCLYYYRINPLSMTGEKKKKIPFDGALLRIERFEKKLPLNHFSLDKQVDEYAIHAIANSILSQLYNNKYKSARHNILAFIRINSINHYINKGKLSRDYRMRLISLFLSIKLILPLKIWTIIGR